MLTGTVHACERLFVQQADKAILVGHVAEHFHDLHVVVACEVHFFEHRGKFELGRSHFVVAGLGRNAELPEFDFNFVHEVQNASRDAAEIVVIHLLMLCRSSTEQRAASLVQVRALQVETLVNQEVFLFGTERDRRLLRASLEAGHQALRRFRKSLQAAQERSLLVESFTSVAAECGGNAKRCTVAVALEECRRSRIPGGIAAGFEGGTQAAARERGSVRFANDQVLAAKGHDGAATFRFKEGVMLFGSGTGERLEPVRKVSSTAVHCPLLHGMGHIACDTRIEGSAFVNGCNQLFADILGQVFAHGIDVEHIFAVEIDIDRCGRLNGRGRGLCDFVDGLFAVAYAHFEPHF